jgi:hypothetical protein
MATAGCDTHTLRVVTATLELSIDDAVVWPRVSVCKWNVII